MRIRHAIIAGAALMLAGCATTGALAPRDARETYVAAELTFQGALTAAARAQELGLLTPETSALLFADFQVIDQTLNEANAVLDLLSSESETAGDDRRRLEDRLDDLLASADLALRIAARRLDKIEQEANR